MEEEVGAKAGMKKGVLSGVGMTAPAWGVRWAGWGGRGGTRAAGGPRAGPPAGVAVVPVAPAPAELTQDLPGRLEAYRTAQVRARVDGIVEKRLFREGSDVKAGQTLYLIDPSTYRAAYAAARAAVSAATQVRDRDKQLLQVQAVSQQDYETAVTNLRQAEAALAQASLDLSNTRVPAPIAGHIGRELVTVGALVGHGDATPMALIEQLDPIYANFVEAGADELRLQKAFASGQLQRAGAATVELVLEDGSVYPEKGKLLFTDKVVDPSTGSIAIRAEFPNLAHQLLPGMFATIRFPQALAERAIKVPQRAVLMNTQGSYVLVVKDDGTVAPRPVKLGAMAGPDFIIDEGLHEGERVIVDGVQKVRPGMLVKTVSAEPQAGGASGAEQPAGAAHGEDSATGHHAQGE